MDNNELSIQLVSQHILEILVEEGPLTKEKLLKKMWRENMLIYCIIDQALEQLIEQNKIMKYKDEYYKICLSVLI
ncbi:MAG: hypothetical protein ACTSQE_14825 [Candidatus Heimdallarchaeaceae archaeon]